MTIQLTFVALATVLGVVCLGSTLPVQADQPSPYRLREDAWKRRPILIATPSRDHPAYRRQISLLLGQRDELVDREIRVIILDAEGADRAGDYLARDGNPKAKDDRQVELHESLPIDALAHTRPLHQDEVEALRKRFRLECQEFRVILIGKDTTAKTDRNSPVDPADLFRQIDTMPMRQREMRQRRDPSSSSNQDLSGRA